ncbi:MAG: rRNA maturation RNase YbeY [Pseudomonadota bacterium]
MTSCATLWSGASSGLTNPPRAADLTGSQAQRRIRVEVERGGATDGPGSERIAGWVSAALEAVECHPARDLDVAVVLAEAADIRRMNRDFRGKDKPTNVLSFPGGELAGLPGDAALLLGDIVLCPEVIAAEAGRQAKAPEHHWCHLCVHGALHLAGYDHVEPQAASAMEAVERKLLAGFGIADPYLPVE